MFRLFYLILLLHFVFSIDHDAYNLKVEYLEKLVEQGVKKAQNYKARLNNEDILGLAKGAEEITDFGEFDFIVVGAGSSGSVIASRLSEIEKWKILLLEAGDLNDDYTDIPYVFDAAAMSDRNWGYLTVPQKNGCFGRKNRQCPYIRGKVLGGTGTINGLVYSRGLKSDYDRWAEAGNPNWSWDKILPYFKKIENFQSENIDMNYRGFGGPITMTYVKPKNILQRAFVEANEERGVPIVDDLNAANLGTSYFQHTIENGKRVSGANNYVRPAWNRINFNVTVKAFVTKILIKNETTKTAYGVEFVRNEKKFRATVTKEVIVSGGATNSPQILMLSGIGPKSELQKHEIRLVQDLPVGRYMKDHIGFVAFYFNTKYSEPKYSNRELIKQYLEGKGLYTDPSNYRSVAYYNVRNKSFLVPNIEITFSTPTPTEFHFPAFMNYRDEVTNYLSRMNPSTAANVQVFLLHPKSSGTVSLKSANPKDFPLLETNIFDDEEDLEDMYRGVKAALNLLNTSVGKSFNMSVDVNLPSCSHTKHNSKKFWYCILRQLAYWSYHLSSTTKMGPPSDPFAVVDQYLRVYGIKNLRVVDVSIVPSTISGHINAAAYMIGERGADFIKEEYLK